MAGAPNPIPVSCITSRRKCEGTVSTYSTSHAYVLLERRNGRHLERVTMLDTVQNGKSCATLGMPRETTGSTKHTCSTNQLHTVTKQRTSQDIIQKRHKRWAKMAREWYLRYRNGRHRKEPEKKMTKTLRTTTSCPAPYERVCRLGSFFHDRKSLSEMLQFNISSN